MPDRWKQSWPVEEHTEGPDPTGYEPQNFTDIILCKLLIFFKPIILDGEAGVSCVEGSCYASWKWQSQNSKSVSELSTTLCISFPPNLNLITRTICCWHSVANQPSDSPRVNDFHMQETIHHQKQIVSQSCLTAKKMWKILTCFNLINLDLMTSLCLALMRHPNKSAWSEKSCSSHRDTADMTYSTL